MPRLGARDVPDMTPEELQRATTRSRGERRETEGRGSGMALRLRPVGGAGLCRPPNDNNSTASRRWQHRTPGHASKAASAV